MSVLTAAAIATLISNCAPNDPEIIRWLPSIIQVESGGNPAEIHVNKNGSTDYGLMQVNGQHLVRFGMNPTTIMDPCQNIRVGATILHEAQVAVSRYNTGSSTAGFINGYVQRVLAKRIGSPPPEAHPKPSKEWDVFAVSSGAQFVFTQNAKGH